MARICLFTFRPIASKQLNSLFTIDILSGLGDALVKHPLWVQEVPGSIPGSGEGFYICLFLFCCCFGFIFCPKTHYLSQIFALPYAMLVYLVYLTDCNIFYRLYEYKDTDLAPCTNLMNVLNAYG